jgi:hypothetical protein
VTGVPGTAFDGVLKIVGGALPEVRGPLYYDRCLSIAVRVVQVQDVNGGGAFAAAAGTPTETRTPQLDKSWVLAVPALVDAGTFVDGAAQASAVAVVDDQTTIRLVEWSHGVTLVT